MKVEKWFIWAWQKQTEKLLSWDLSVHLKSLQNDTNLQILSNEWKLFLKLTTYSNMDWLPVPTPVIPEFRYVNGKLHGHKIVMYRHIMLQESLLFYSLSLLVDIFRLSFQNLHWFFWFFQIDYLIEWKAWK